VNFFYAGDSQVVLKHSRLIAKNNKQLLFS
jgi:hypothetical protein